MLFSYNKLKYKKMKPKFLLLIVSVLLLGSCTYTQDETPVRHTIIGNGIGLGGAIAVVTSWSRNRSILWAIIHGILSWFYVIYFYLTRTSDER